MTTMFLLSLRPESLPECSPCINRSSGRRWKYPAKSNILCKSTHIGTCTYVLLCKSRPSNMSPILLPADYYCNKLGARTLGARSRGSKNVTYKQQTDMNQKL